MLKGPRNHTTSPYRKIHAMIFILLYMLFFPIVSSLDYSCYPSSRPLPKQEHCFELTDYIRRYSRLFPDQEKEWGRDLESTLTTEKLPKVYWMDAPESRTCAIYLDIKEQYRGAVEYFKVRTVASTADVIIIRCLVGRRMIGTIPMGTHRLVVGQLLRYDPPSVRGGVKLADFENGTSLWGAELDADSARNISLAPEKTVMLDAS